MDYVADFHLHSKYSRAVSKDMELATMARFARLKGLDIITAADWTHGLWFKEIKNKLEESDRGLYKLKADTDSKPVQFILSTEIASIYTQGGRLRRIHNLVFAPSLLTAEKINKELIRRGCNLLSDGRPIVGISSKDLLELILSIDGQCMLIPCHIWTPHFGIYGSASGFDSLEEAFGELSSYIYAVETGLSSDPEMNWQIRELMSRSIVSFSDAHSPAKMGREATVFSSKEKESISYEDIRLAFMRRNDDWKIGYTVEFYPEEGKYHFSGHRNCKVVRDPKELETNGDICPVCKKKLTEGVLVRVQQLSNKNLMDRGEKKMSPKGIQWFVDRQKNHPPFVKLVPLQEIVAESLESTVFSQKVKFQFESLCREFVSELNVLLKTPIVDIRKFAGPKIAEAVERVRKGDIVIDPGFDGEYGKVEIWKSHNESEKEVTEKNSSQSQLGLEF